MGLSILIHKKPALEELCQYLAINICPSGEIARVYCGRLDSDGNIRTAAAFGYSKGADVMGIVTPIGFDRPMPDATRSRKIIVANREEILTRYKNYEPLDMKSPWIATAVVPTYGKLVFVFRLQREITNLDYAENYFQIVGALLSLYEYRSEDHRNVLVEFDRKPLVPSTKRNLHGKPLTERQELILQKIKEGSTNIHIANLLGYSESLIRQETIIIYAKLGVDGRRELLHDEVREIS